MNYQKAISYINSLYNYEKDTKKKKKFSLKIIRHLARLYKNPQEKLNIVHVAGTKGKGTVSYFLANILRNAGYTVGLYTSPHITTIRERIKINQENISMEDFAAQVTRLRNIINKSRLKPSYFEALTIIALDYFKRKKVGLAIIETGLGGRLDATNIVTPIVSVLTSISIDHKMELGNTLKSIAFEKAEIIKNKTITISSPQKKPVERVLNKKAKEKSTKVIYVGRQIKFKKLKHKYLNECFSVSGIIRKYPKLAINIPGVHNVINASLSVGAAECLETCGFNIKNKSVIDALKYTVIPGRFQVVGVRPLVVLDAAHNPDSLKRISSVFKRNFKNKKVTLITAMSKDKEIKKMCSRLDFAHFTIVTTYPFDRSVSADKIYDCIKSRKKVIVPDIEAAFEISKRLSGRDDIIFITGSFYIIEDFLAKGYERNNT